LSSPTVPLLMTGRNISAAHEAHGSLRVQGTAFAIGHASGPAAANDKTQPRHVDVRKVQRLLISQHANLEIDASAPRGSVA